MPKGYWVANVDVNDLDAYRKYIAANARAFSKYGARFLVRGGRHEVVEGAMRSRIVVIEFPDYDTALACYRSPEYQQAKALREAHADGNLAIVEGWDG